MFRRSTEAARNLIRKRTVDNAYRAFMDRCPHRFTSLQKQQIQHLTSDSSGQKSHGVLFFCSGLKRRKILPIGNFNTTFFKVLRALKWIPNVSFRASSTSDASNEITRKSSDFNERFSTRNLKRNRPLGLEIEHHAWFTPSTRHLSLPAFSLNKKTAHRLPIIRWTQVMEQKQNRRLTRAERLANSKWLVQSTRIRAKAQGHLLLAQNLAITQLHGRAGDLTFIKEALPGKWKNLKSVCDQDDLMFLYWHISCRLIEMQQTSENKKRLNGSWIRRTGCSPTDIHQSRDKLIMQAQQQQIMEEDKIHNKNKDSNV